MNGANEGAVSTMPPAHTHACIYGKAEDHGSLLFYINVYNTHTFLMVSGALTRSIGPFLWPH